MIAHINKSQRARFASLCRNKPTSGMVLRSKSGEGISVTVHHKQTWETWDSTKLRMMFVNAAIDDEATGWFLTNKSIGLKCIFLMESQERLVDTFKGNLAAMTVQEVVVIRQSRYGNALLCEVL